jgi:regulatory protein
VARRRAATRSGGGHDGPVPGTPADLTPDADPQSVARAIVLRQLTAGPRSRAQLTDALVRRGVPPDVVERVLDRFEEVELVDDAEFARQWVQTRHTGRGLARRALSHELRHRGIDDETARAAVGRIDDDDELLAAQDLVRRRLRAMSADDPDRRTRRLAGMLARKGYSSGVAMRAIRDCVAEAADVAAGDEDDLAHEACTDPHEAG